MAPIYLLNTWLQSVGPPKTPWMIDFFSHSCARLIHDIDGSLCLSLTCNTSTPPESETCRVGYLCLSGRPHTRARDRQPWRTRRRRTTSARRSGAARWRCRPRSTRPSASACRNSSRRAVAAGWMRGGDIAFLSVAGGERTAVGQARLLRQVRGLLTPSSAISCA
jgi:hypothetical protein